jgi:hypothetical protein
MKILLQLPQYLLEHCLCLISPTGNQVFFMANNGALFQDSIIRVSSECQDLRLRLTISESHLSAVRTR